jgi:hypothetical protein
MEARDQPFGLLTFLCFYILLYHDGKGSLWITRALPYNSKHPTIVEVREAWEGQGSHIKSARLFPCNYLLCALPRANLHRPRKCQRAPGLGTVNLVTSRLKQCKQNGGLFSSGSHQGSYGYSLLGPFMVKLPTNDHSSM